MTTRVAHPRYDSYHMNEMINYFKVSPIMYSSDRDIHATICTLFFFFFFLGSFSPTFLVFYFYVTHAHVSNLLFIVYPQKNRLLFINACFAYSKSNSLWPFHVQRHWLLSLKPPSTQKEEERMKDWGGYPDTACIQLIS